jgi:hypothetical protein
MKNVFRILIVAEIISAISVFILGTIYEKKLPIELQKYLNHYYLKKA